MRLEDYPQSSRPDAHAQLVSPVCRASHLRLLSGPPRSAASQTVSVSAEVDAPPHRDSRVQCALSPKAETTGRPLSPTPPPDGWRCRTSSRQDSAAASRGGDE